MPRSVSIVVYSPANMNAIDGSSVWTQTMTLALAGVENVDVTLLLSHAKSTDRLLRPLLDHPEITVIDPVADRLTDNEPLSLDQAAAILSRMARHGSQAFVVRGARAAHRFAQERRLAGKLWPYLTDLPQRANDIDDHAHRAVSAIMSASPILMCQTEEMALFLETQFPSVAGKSWLFPPAIPEDISPVILPAPTATDLRLCYAGKFASKWKTHEMCDLPTRLADRGIEARLTMVGDKVNQDADRPGFVMEMIRKLEFSPGVEWVGGVSRERSIELMSSAHVGVSWRAAELNDSLELSTKLLEYCAAGTPPLLNRTAMHERIFGKEYPLFVGTDGSVVDLLEDVVRKPEVYEAAIGSISGISNDYTLGRAIDRLSDLVDTMFPGIQTRLRWWRFGAS